MTDLQTIESTVLSASLPLSGAETAATPSFGATDASQHVQQRLLAIHTAPRTSYQGQHQDRNHELELFEALVKFKVLTSQVAMHLDDDWRTRLFRQLDSLLDVNEWDNDDQPPTAESFHTFLKMILSRGIEVRPGLGASADGHLIAAWTVGDAKLTIECLPSDQVRWSVARTVEEKRERAAGIGMLKRLSAVLQPFDPQVWFLRGK